MPNENRPPIVEAWPSTEFPKDRIPTMRMVARPQDANIHGDIFGGWIMSMVDIAGGMEAARRARGRVSTVSVNAFTFKAPVFVGDMVNLYAEVIRVGRTSITVDVQVWAERDIGNPQPLKVTEAVLTYVAVDANRKPRPVDPPGPIEV